MSAETPNRPIGGLTPRAGTHDLSRLQARNRPEPKVETDQEPTAAGSAAAVKPSRMPAKKSATVVVVSTARMTTYLSAITRDRARATYRATSHIEGDKSWSDFVERAILAEVERRELAHHAGERYEGDSSSLPVGRPLS
ncbi:ParB family protein [Cryobacterium zongtaii]|uniref:ParB family protein n=1 Tax=Cryobacterium zongtaii TaxID=1259217 RepID=UPI0013FD92B2